MPREQKPARLWLNKRKGRDPVWVILHRGKQISTGCGSDCRSQAEEKLAEYIGEQRQIPKREDRLDRLLIADVITVYLKEHAPHTATPEWLGYMAMPVIRLIGDQKLSAIRAPMCRDYVGERVSEGVSDQTARHELKQLRAAINYWHANYGPLSAVPVVTLPSKAPTKRGWLTRSEVARQLWELRKTAPHIARALLIGVYSGSRPGVCLSVRWLPSIDAPYFDVEAGLFYRSGAQERATKKAKPTQKIHARLLVHLRRWHRLDAGRVADVCHFEGAAPKRIQKAWHRARIRAGLPDWVTPHVWRHTAATWQMQAGTDLYEASGYLGMSVETLQQTYGHHHPDYQQGAASARAR